MSKVALIFGISGQDGAYLSKLLLEKGYKVHGTSRDAEMATFSSLKRLGIKNQILFHSVALNDFRSTSKVLEDVAPDEIYNLAGQSSVGLSFEQPLETLESIANATINILEAIKFLGCDCKLYNAGSSECFGDTGGIPADENTPFRPKSPYGVAKASAYWLISNYRESYKLFACSGITFNHESILRPTRFVTRKICHAAAKIALGQQTFLKLGDLTPLQGAASMFKLSKRFVKWVANKDCKNYVLHMNLDPTMNHVHVSQDFRTAGILNTKFKYNLTPFFLWTSDLKM